MAKKPQDADDELANLLDSLDTPSTKPPTSTTAPFKKPSRTQTAEDMDLDAELAALEASATAPRSGTPRISTPVGGRPAPTQNTRLPTEAPRGRTSEDNRAPRKSTESGRSGGPSYAFTPSASTTSLPDAADTQSAQDKQDISDAAQVQVDAGRRMSEMLDTAAPAETAKDVKEGKPPVAAAAGGGWWGSIVATAAAAAKTAEAAVKEIQHNEEFKRRAEQVKGNVGALRGLGESDEFHNAGTDTQAPDTQLSRRERLLAKLESTLGGARPGIASRLSQLGPHPHFPLPPHQGAIRPFITTDRKSTRLNSSHWE